MAKQIICQGKIIPNDWIYISQLEGADIPEGKIVLSLNLWNQHAARLASRRPTPGLFLASHENPADFVGDIKAVPLIMVSFPAFTDGRGFSIGNLLRERYAFGGELRAHGNFIRDQLFYLKRCGFDAFEFETAQSLEAALPSLRDFTESYQAANDQPIPLFRRR